MLLGMTTVCAFPQDSLQSAGAKAPSFILNKGPDNIESITWPYMKKIVLLHFWSAETPGISSIHSKIRKLYRRYRDASYRNAEGFEVMTVAAQADRTSWQDQVWGDTLGDFVNGIAPAGLSDPLCEKFHVTSLPTDILIDEEGNIVATNVSFAALENLLDDRRNSQQVKKTITGKVALANNPKEALRYGRVFLFNSYGDSLAKCTATDKGVFVFDDVKLSQDLVLKVDNKTDINTTDPLALYTVAGDFVMDGRTRDEGFIFFLPARLNGKLVIRDSMQLPSNAMLGEINVVKSLTFTVEGASLTPRDEQELTPILFRLQRNNAFNLELITHTDTRLDAVGAMELSLKQANALKKYFEGKGIAASRIKAVAKGNMEPRKICDGTIDCRENDYRMNRRVEFMVYRD
jgi:outer membrane protein OmpA-like peptidoglycan-associated protein